jgi:hypothetical protein
MNEYSSLIVQVIACCSYDLWENEGVYEVFFRFN